METKPPADSSLPFSSNLQETPSVLHAALEYLRLGLSVIPLCIYPDLDEPGKVKKVPALPSWTEYQKRRATEEEIRAWFDGKDGLGVGIVTGRLSGIMVADFDGAEGERILQEKDLALTPMARTGSGGYHVLFRYPNGEEIRNHTRVLPGVDIRAEGGFIAATPSAYPGGKRYEWLHPPDQVPLADAPAWLLDLCRKDNGEGEDRGPRIDPVSILEGVPEGARDDLLFREACRLRALNLIREEAEILILHGSRNAQPPFPDNLALEKLKQAYKYPAGAAKALSNQPTEGRTSTFPKEAIGGLAGRFANLYSQYLESPWSFWAFNFLTCLGNVLADMVTLESAISPQPRLYTVLLGESASERKSESLRQTLAFFEEALPSDFHPCLGIGSAEGLMERLKEGASPPVSHSVSKLLLSFDEFKSFVNKASIEASVLLPAVNTLFDSNSYHSQTKAHAINISGAYLSIMAASTVDTFTRMWTPTFTDIGFLNRLWLVPDRAEKRFSLPGIIPQAEHERLKKSLVSLVESLGTLRVLRMTQEARACFDEWYVSAPNSLFSKRLDTYGHRLMILLAIQEGEEEVAGGIAERVCTLLNWQLQVRREHDPIDAENRVAKMEEAIRRVLMRGPLYPRDLQKAVHYERAGLFVWNQAINNLKSAGEICFDPKGKVHLVRTRE